MPARFFNPQSTSRARKGAKAQRAVQIVQLFRWLAISLALSTGLHAVSGHFGTSSSASAGSPNVGAVGNQNGVPSTYDSPWWQPHELALPASISPSNVIPDPGSASANVTQSVDRSRWQSGAFLSDPKEDSTLPLAPIGSNSSQAVYRILDLADHAPSQSTLGSSAGELHFSLSGTVNPEIFYLSSDQGLSLVAIPEPSMANLLIAALAAVGGLRWRVKQRARKSP